MKATQEVKMAVASLDSMGEPDFYFCKVRCTEKQRASGAHYRVARYAARENGYDPYLAFEEDDPAGPMLMEHFLWETASVYPEPTR